MPPEIHPSTRATLSFAVLAALLAWETAAPFLPFFANRAGDRTRHAARNVALGLVNAIVTAAIFSHAWQWAGEFSETRQIGLLHRVQFTGWHRVFSALLLFDLWMYAWHRLAHGVPMLWKFHRTHHTDARMDVTTANRFHLGEIIASSVLRIPVIALLGIRLPELALYETAMFAVVQFQHANISVGPRADALLRLFIVTPFIHKVHHSRWQPETDSNFASLFSIWDRVFRTQRLREDPGTIQFGLDEFDAPAHHTLGGMMKTPFANGSGVESNASQPPRRQE